MQAVLADICTVHPRQLHRETGKMQWLIPRILEQPLPDDCQLAPKVWGAS
jgi:hypothetical protein